VKVYIFCATNLHVWVACAVEPAFDSIYQFLETGFVGSQLQRLLVQRKAQRAILVLHLPCLLHEVCKAQLGLPKYNETKTLDMYR
jgi:hypothetical protein